MILSNINLILIKNILPDNSNVNWNIVELPEVVNAGKQKFEDENLKIVGNTIVFNPGNAHKSYELKYSQKMYFRKSSVLIFETKSKKIKFFNLE